MIRAVLAAREKDWFSVDKAGLAKLLEKRGKAFALFELIQNAWDTHAGCVQVVVEPIAGRPLASVRVEDDDPDGFANLSHAFTLFAESEKKGDASKRGRFNLGEKLVLALCEEAEIRSTKGVVYFEPDGRRVSNGVASRTERGSYFRGTMRMTRAELEDVERSIRQLIPPFGCRTVFNGATLPSREHIAVFDATLPTEVGDEEGYLRRTQRQTAVSVHAVAEGESPTLYEMGIPVVEFSGGERWHVNVHQKVPLNVDRDNVTPAYLQTIRVLLANEMRDQLTREDAGQVWVNAATEDERIDSEAVAKVLDQRFGKKRAIFDPSDPEANKQLMNEGFTVIPGGSLSKGQWSNVRAAGLAAPAGQVRPSGVQFADGGRPQKVIDPGKYTSGQRRIVDFTRAIAKRLIGKTVEVVIVSEPCALPHAAWYGGNTLTFNVGRLGRAWFDDGIRNRHVELVLHELAHDRVKDHLTRDFADEVGRLGVKLVALATRDSAMLIDTELTP